MKDKFLIALGFIFVLLISIPVPNFMITSLIALLLLGLIVITVLLFRSLHKKTLIQRLPGIILCWTLFLLIIMISATRNIILTEEYENQNILIRYFGSDLIANKAYIGLPITIIIIAISLIFIEIPKHRIENLLTNLEDKIAREELEYVSSLDGVIKCISGTTKLAVIMFGVEIIACTLVHFIIYKQEITEVLNQSFVLATGITNLLVLMLTFCSFCCDYFISEFFKERNE